MAIGESESEILPSLTIVVIIDALPPFEVGEHDPPAHGEEVFVEGAFDRVELHVYPSEEHLTVFEVVEAEHQLDGTNSDEEGDIQPVIWGRVISSLLDPTKEAHKDALGLLEADMPRLRMAVPILCLDDLLLLIGLIVC